MPYGRLIHDDRSTAACVIMCRLAQAIPCSPPPPSPNQKVSRSHEHIGDEGCIGCLSTADAEAQAGTFSALFPHAAESATSTQLSGLLCTGS